MAFSETTQLAVTPSRSWRELMQLGVVLFKARVVSLLLLAAVGGAFLAAGGWPGFGTLIVTIVTGGLAAGGASALNQYIERDRDKTMSRTRKRPLPTETLDSEMIPMIGANMIVLPAIAVYPFRPMLAFFLLLGAIIYVGIYTVWLKPRTLLNIVIGGAAGSAAVMSGAAAAGNWTSPAAIVLALIVFLWTPAHFWSLAILYKDDYKNAKIPMLPTIMSDRNAAWWVMAHTLPTAFAALLLGVVPMLGWTYWLLVIPFSIDMIRRNIRFIRQPVKQNALRFFLSSNVYLLVVIVAACLASVVTSLF